MDAKSIWPGFDYAHTNFPSRGVEYYKGADRVKAITTLDRVEPGNTRNTTFVKVYFLDDDGTPKSKRVYNTETGVYDTVEDIGEVRARELFMRWDEYEDETEHRNAQEAEADRERRERQERERQEREERERLQRIEREQRDRLRDEKGNKVLEGLRKSGFSMFSADKYSEKITITYDDFLAWLDSLERVDCKQCDRQLVKLVL